MSVPELRFKEFTDSWKETLLGDFANFHDSKRVPISENERKSKQGPYPYYGASGIIDYVDDYIFDGEYVLLGEDGANIITRSTRLAFLIKGKSWVNNHAHVLSTDESNYFLSEALERIRYDKYNTGTAQPKLNASVCRKIKLSIPSLNEQQKIASFLGTVDKRIELLTKKKDLLEEYKKGVMQKLFSQEIRFKDENGNDYPYWEEKKLKEIINEFIVPMRDKPKKFDGSIPWCRIEDFDGKYLSLSKTSQGVSADTVKTMNLKVFPINTLLVSCSAYLGRCAIVQKELITNQTFIGLVPNHQQSNVEFLYYLIGFKEKELNKLSSGTTISYLSRKEFENFKISIPRKAEQQKIANFLDVIDQKIKQTSQQIEGTKTFKKGLLQKMFV